MSEPPSYDPDTDSTDKGPETVLPSTVYVAGRFIHPSDPQAPPLYELSHSVGFLRDTDRKVVLSRLDYSLRGTAARTPQVVTRPRTLFDLTHRTPAELPTYPFQAEAKSRSAIGHLGIESFRPRRFSLGSRRKAFRVVRARMGTDRRLVAGAALYTAVTPSGSDGDVAWEWVDDREALVAREVVKEGMMSLVVTAEMAQPLRDALMASWMLRLWWELAERGLGSSIGGMSDRGRLLWGT